MTVRHESFTIHVHDKPCAVKVILFNSSRGERQVAMFRTIRRSFQLVKLCLHVLAADKELVFFPVISSICTGIVVLTFLGVGFGIGALDRLAEESLGIIDLVVALAFYILSSFVIIFFNSALVFAAHERLAGGDPNIRSGLSGASSRIGPIFMWAVIAGTVGLILRILAGRASERQGVLGIIGAIVVALLGAAWSLLTFFVVPLIVIERRPFSEAFKTSLSMIRSTWGDQVTANFGLGIAALLAFLLAVAISVLLFFVLSPLGAAGVIIASLVAVVMVVAVALVFATLEGIYKAALYSYAATGVVPTLFPDETIQNAFRQR